MDSPIRRQAHPMRGTLKEPLIACSVYLLCALLLTHEAWWGQQIVGGSDTPDRAGTVWASWWVGKALSLGQNPFTATANYLPIGQGSLSQFNLLDAFIAAPGVWMFGPQTGFNMACVLVLASTAASAYLLGKVVGMSPAGAWLMGLGMISSNFLLLEIAEGRLSQALLGLWFLGLAGLLQILRHPTRRRFAVGVGLCIGAAAYTYWYNAMFLAFAFLPFLVAHNPRASRQTIQKLLIAIGTAALVCAPAIIHLAFQYNDLPGVSRITPHGGGYPGLDRGLFSLTNSIETAHWPFWPISIEPWLQTDKRLPVFVLVLALLGALKQTRQIWPWACMALIGWVLTLGPYLHWTEEKPLGLPLPALWLHDWLPFFSRFWWPQRLELLVLVGLLAAAALELSRIQASRAAFPNLAVWALATTPLWDAPWRNSHIQVPSAPTIELEKSLYQQIDGPILTTPVLQNFQKQLWLQTLHEQPVLAGLGDNMPSHRPPEFNNWLNTNTLFSGLVALQQGKSKPFNITPTDIEPWIAAGYRWAVVDAATMPESNPKAWMMTFAHFFEQVWGPPDVQSERGFAWKIHPIDSEAQVFTSFQSGRPPRLRDKQPQTAND